MATYRVMREHEGDRFYTVGEVRELDPSAAADLVGLRVLDPIADAAPEKSKAAPPNKREAQPANKAEYTKIAKGA